MKIVMLVESSMHDFEELIDVVNNRNLFLIDTENCSEENEFRHLLNNIKNFSQSDKDVMLAKFSGRENVTKNIGDECSEMIITLSDRKTSKYYTECPKNTFLDLINIFDKETINGITA